MMKGKGAHSDGSRKGGKVALSLSACVEGWGERKGGKEG